MTLSLWYRKLVNLRSGKIYEFALYQEKLMSELNSSSLKILCQFSFDLAAATVLRMFEMPGDTLIHGRVFGHLIFFVPVFVYLSCVGITRWYRWKNTYCVLIFSSIFLPFSFSGFISMDFS